MSPCTYCEKAGKTCVVASAESLRCSECVRSKKKCDVEGIPVGDWNAVEREEFRLDTAEMLAEDTLRKAQSQMNEALNRLSRLRKQKQFLRKRAADMLRRGLKTMDELDEVEEREKLEREAVELASQRQAISADLGSIPETSNHPGPSEYPSGQAFEAGSAFSPFPWESFDLAGGTAPGDPGSSGF